MTGENKQPGAAETAAPRQVTVPLTGEATAHGQKITELNFREPTGQDIGMCGVPCTLDFAVDPPRVAFNAPEMSAMMSSLAAVPMSTINSLPAQDWINCAWKLSRFFVPRLTI
jgi:hypothetical protein